MGVPISIQRIAPLPLIAVEILSRIPAAANAVDGDLHALLQQEAELVAEIILVANRRVSADIHPSNAVEAIEQIPATDLAEIAFTLVVRHYMQRAFAVTGDRRYWRYSLACAFICQELVGLKGNTGLRAYAAGLLHDIGRLALIAAYPDKYANLLTLTNSVVESGRPFDVSERERMLFGLDRFETGDYLAATWKLPVWLHPVVGRFDAESTAPHHELIETVRAGAQLAHSLGFGSLQAAPRQGVREILNKLPSALRQWEARDQWKLGGKAWHARIEPRLGWY